MTRSALTVAACALVTLWVLAAPPDAQQEKNHEEALARGKRVYQVQCARCHGIQGTGGTGANLARPVLRNAATDQDLLALIKDGIEGTAMPANWFLTDAQVRDVAHYVRSLGRVESQPLPGDPELGKKVYARSDCAKCHMIAGAGGSLGPDLTEVGARRGVDFLRAAVVHPGREKLVDEWGYTRYLPVVITTGDGRVLSGTRINEDTFTIQIRDATSRLQSLDKRALDELHKTGASMMPTYDTMFSPRDIDHLSSYLASLRASTP
jgi:putative heme-binding domain-containing protein